jgi:D-glycero-D-manno-heptose 1,7-bisphosphate phosphatase
MYPALFLDRDGVLLENNPTYIRSWSEARIYPRALTALARIRESAYKVVIVTNQAGVAKGLIPADIAEDINRHLVEEIEETGGRVDGVFMCTHAVEDACTCRKPQPGLLLEAARELSLDLGSSIMIGDAVTDLMAGRAAGVGKVVMVRTGRGAEQSQLPEASDLQPFPTYDTLAEALADLI